MNVQSRACVLRCRHIYCFSAIFLGWNPVISIGKCERFPHRFPNEFAMLTNRKLLGNHTFRTLTVFVCHDDFGTFIKNKKRDLFHHIAHCTFLVHSSMSEPSWYTYTLLGTIQHSASVKSAMTLSHGVSESKLNQWLKFIFLHYSLFLTQTTKAFYNEFRTFTNKSYRVLWILYRIFCPVLQPLFTICFHCKHNYTEFHLLWSLEKRKSLKRHEGE